MRRLITAAAAALLAAGVAALAAPPAGATAPAIARFAVDLPTFFLGCDKDLAYVVDLEVKGIEQVFPGEDGAPTLIRVHGNVDGTMTEIATGSALRVHHAFTATIDLVEGTFTSVGLPFGVFGPTGGFVIRDAGRIVSVLNADGFTFTVIFEAGVHELAEAGGVTLFGPDPEVLCDLLA